MARSECASYARQPAEEGPRPSTGRALAARRASPAVSGRGEWKYPPQPFPLPVGTGAPAVGVVLARLAGIGRGRHTDADLRLPVRFGRGLACGLRLAPD